MWNEEASAKPVRRLWWLGVRMSCRSPEPKLEPKVKARFFCDQHQFRSIVFVATKDHSRRTRRVLDRIMKSNPVRITVQPARYSSFDPDRWWQTRSGIRTEIIELQKLVFEAVLHPMSF